MEQPIEYLKNNKAYIAQSKVSGRGVFALNDIAVGEVIEICPMVPLINRSRYQLEPNIWKYCYTKPLCDCADCKNHGFLFYMVAGYGMMYNHQDNNTATFRFDYNELVGTVIAIKEIKAGEEIFVNYGPDYFKNITKIDHNNIKTEDS